MPNLLTEQEFTERFTTKLRTLPLGVESSTPLAIELHYGADEPALSLALQDAYSEYQEDPDKLESITELFLKDLHWTVQEPRYGYKKVVESILPILRNFVEMPPAPSELDSDPNCPKGPIAYTEVLRTTHEYITAQFVMKEDDKYIPLRRGDVLPCLPNPGALTEAAFHNLAAVIDQDGISAFPLGFDSLKLSAWLIGLTHEHNKALVAALVCIPQAMLSIEETLGAKEGIVVVIPSQDQLIVSIDVDEESTCQLGLLCRQLQERAPYPLSTLIWKFKNGALEGVQAMEMDEQSA